MILILFVKGDFSLINEENIENDNGKIGAISEEDFYDGGKKEKDSQNRKPKRRIKTKRSSQRKKKISTGKY